MYQSFKHPPRSIGQTGVFTSYSLNLSSPVVDLFMTAPFFTASLYHAGPERGFGWDFACGSPPLSQDWVQVACSRKTWRLNNWWGRYDFNCLTSCFWLDFGFVKRQYVKAPLDIMLNLQIVLSRHLTEEKWMPQVSPNGRGGNLHQSSPTFDSLVLLSPLCNMRASIINSVPCDRIVQKALSPILSLRCAQGIMDCSRVLERIGR